MAMRVVVQVRKVKIIAGETSSDLVACLKCEIGRCGVIKKG